MRWLARFKSGDFVLEDEERPENIRIVREIFGIHSSSLFKTFKCSWINSKSKKLDDMLKCYKNQSFLHRIVTSDEKWIRYYNLNQKKWYVKSGSIAQTLPLTSYIKAGYQKLAWFSFGLASAVLLRWTPHTAKVWKNIYLQMRNTLNNTFTCIS